MTSKDIPLCMAACLIITFFQWFRLKNRPTKDKAAYLSILALCWMLAIVLVMNPGMPGPTQLVNYIFYPLGKLLDH
ncbi:hypothetical protein P5G65_00800 [Paenibacillus chondroitinus]|uniref:Uncharacterized protein n=1 Tax=Paenibacillus chondroitinus TaxID=59842 RepID=A0ABU6D4P5_9BACL|nr:MULTISPECIES: hypothetical protein [Paenibacillus]MCY9660781.1 hypothetical protein [Paenibacillus anseongense]MEB4792421.1 hypothetical protein [Paenibacillus chondroitinus]